MRKWNLWQILHRSESMVLSSNYLTWIWKKCFITKDGLISAFALWVEKLRTVILHIFLRLGRKWKKHSVINFSFLPKWHFWTRAWNSKIFLAKSILLVQRWCRLDAASVVLMGLKDSWLFAPFSQTKPCKTWIPSLLKYSCLFDEIFEFECKDFEEFDLTSKKFASSH